MKRRATGAMREPEILEAIHFVSPSTHPVVVAVAPVVAGIGDMALPLHREKRNVW